MTTAPAKGSGADDESARLEGLGYTSEFKREMSLSANFALGFTYLSPVVATYTEARHGDAVPTGPDSTDSVSAGNEPGQ